MAFIFVIIVAFSNLFSAEPDYCKDFYSYACKTQGPPNPKDEEIRLAEDLYESNGQYQLLMKFQNQEANIKSKILVAISDPNGNSLREAVIGAFNLEKEGVCSQKTNSSNRKTCDIEISNLIYDIFKADLSQAQKVESKHEISIDRLERLLKSVGLSDLHRSILAPLINGIPHRVSLEKVHDELFPQVRNALISKLRIMNISALEKEKMIEKIKRIQLSENVCEVPGAPLAPQAAYVPSNGINELIICKGAMVSYDQLGLRFALAHELAHGIDTCFIQEGEDATRVDITNSDLRSAESKYPIANLVSCLRHENSVKAIAKPRTLFEKGVIFLYKKIGGDFKEMCGDQVQESIADWFAAEHIGEMLGKAKSSDYKSSALALKRALSVFCTDEGERGDSFDIHPLRESRVNNIIMQNPDIRAALNCTASSSGYCDGSFPYPIKNRQRLESERKKVK